MDPVSLVYFEPYRPAVLCFAFVYLLYTSYIHRQKGVSYKYSIFDCSLVKKKDLHSGVKYLNKQYFKVLHNSFFGVSVLYYLYI
jgi:hypothetical protein